MSGIVRRLTRFSPPACNRQQAVTVSKTAAQTATSPEDVTSAACNPWRTSWQVSDAIPVCVRRDSLSSESYANGQWMSLACQAYVDMAKTYTR